MSITLYPAVTDLKTLETVWRNGTPARLAPEARDLIEATAAQVQVAATGDEPVYGINTGFGNWRRSGFRRRTPRCYNAI